MDPDPDLCHGAPDFARAPASGDNDRCRSRNVVAQTSFRTNKFGLLDSVSWYSLRSLWKSYNENQNFEIINEYVFITFVKSLMWESILYITASLFSSM